MRATARRPIPELQPEDGYLTIMESSLYAIAHRVSAVEALPLEFIACCTTSAKEALPRWVPSAAG